MTKYKQTKKSKALKKSGDTSYSKALLDMLAMPLPVPLILL